jgi:phosphodiesterase/alkaline phosphatase D-like protein
MKFSVYSAPPTEGKGLEAPKRIVVGSCHTQHFHPSRIWKTIQNENPDLHLLLGDNVYIDSYKEEKHRAASFRYAFR